MNIHSDGWYFPEILASSALFGKNFIFAVFRRKLLFFIFLFFKFFSILLHLVVLIVGFCIKVLCNSSLFDSLQWKINEEIEGGEYFLINYNIIKVIIVVTYYSRISHLTLEILFAHKATCGELLSLSSFSTLSFWILGNFGYMEFSAELIM